MGRPEKIYLAQAKMMKNYFLTVDTETTQDNLVADFAATITDKKGNIVSQCAVLTTGIYTNPEQHALFWNGDAGVFGRSTLAARYGRYNAMVENGARMVASVGAVNRWLARANSTYSPILTAYNLPFDTEKCRNTGIDLDQFTRSFCMYGAAFNTFATSKAYRNFALSVHAFNAPTALGNMTYKTNAETMARFVLDNPELPNEPHTALEDILDYELPILQALLKKRSVKNLLADTRGPNWRAIQVKDWFTAS